MRRLRECLVLCVILAGGCANIPERPAIPLPEDLARLDRWQAHGRLAVAGPEGGGSGSFDWRQRGERADVSIRGPIGVGSVRLQLRGGAHPEITLETSDGQKLQSVAALEELEARLGATVPAASLRYWLLGLPAPGEHRWSGEGEGGPVTLEQDGWRIDYQRYSTEPGARVPVRIRASSGEARVRIVVDSWQLGR
jgi:outer membrane lipoprotein LolB